MSQVNLKLLQDARDKILKAEMAGLLHNIGKLDPNFLAQVLGAKNPLKLKHANDLIASESLNIPQYAYKRFSAPDASILGTNIEVVVTDFHSRMNPSFLDFCQALKACSTTHTEIQALIDDWSNAQKDFPFTARSLNAIWQFFSFASVNNGPLYLLLPGDRDKIGEWGKKLSGLTQELGSLSTQIRSVPIDQKKPIGIQINQRKDEKEQIEKELNTLFDSIQKRQEYYEAAFRAAEARIAICNENWAIADLLTLFWDKFFFYKPDEDESDYKRQPSLSPWLRGDTGTALTALLILAHGEVSGAEKGRDDDETTESESDEEDYSPAWEFLCQSSAFGLDKQITEIEFWPEYRRQLLDHSLLACANSVLQRDDFLGVAKRILSLGVGDTQWPINDVDLLNYASSIAALFKSSVAKAVLENKLPTVAEVKWRLLSIRYDGLEYLSQAHHISDLLARREALNAALDAVKTVIEVEYPLGNEIYRDEKGSVLLVPGVRDGEQPIELLAQSCGDDGNLEDLILKRFAAASYGEGNRSPLAGEIKPLIALSGEKLGKAIKLPEAEGWANPSLQADPVAVDKWWSDKKKHGELCTVCGLRPQGYRESNDSLGKKAGWKLHLEENHHQRKQPLDCEVCKAIDRQICWDCMERRDDRARKWANDPDALKRTIWMDEVADSNGRLALVVGRFVMDGWLDGQLIATMQKSDSFARIQRCWRTTLEFWQGVEKDLPAPTGNDRKRKIFTAQNPNTDKLGDYHVYDLDLNGHTINVVWDKAQARFITADNLDYFQKNGGSFDLPGNTAVLFESSSHAKRRTKNQALTGTITLDDISYSPHIRILAQPSLFMALVPADKALAVVRTINEKYETEMGKVRDRLPLHVGIVYAPRRTPVRALLEAGRKMLKLPDHWEQWTVQANIRTPTHHEIKFDNGIEWKISAVMGDQTTTDQWYPHLLKRKPNANENLNDTKPWDHAKDLQPGTIVAVRPSRFDFEFLDTAGRRLEISYDNQCNRRGSATRPFLLEDVSMLDKLWDLLVRQKKLSTSHLQHLESVLTHYITEWFQGDIAEAAKCETYKQFAKDTLHQLDAKWWKSLDENERTKLDNAITSGMIFDLLELRMHILKEKPEGETV